MVGQVIAILGLIVFHSPVIIIMGFTTVFFDNAIIAIFANKRGGVKAAMIIPFICGLIQVLLGAVTVWLVELVPYVDGTEQQTSLPSGLESPHC